VSRRASVTDTFEVADVAGRLAPYGIADTADSVEEVPADDVDELVERGMTLLRVMPAQKRGTVEDLLSPNDPEKGRRAVDALIESAFAAEDESGRLRRLG
jgi:hypothetical protein